VVAYRVLHFPTTDLMDTAVNRDSMLSILSRPVLTTTATGKNGLENAGAMTWNSGLLARGFMGWKGKCPAVEEYSSQIFGGR
jgi:hypothetical protein